MKPKSRQVGIGVIAGSTAGLAGGLAMIPFIILGGLSTGDSLTTVFLNIGFVFGADADSAVVLGIVMHLAASVFIGIIFGITTGAADMLRITNYTRGVVLGVIAGMIAFAALFIPVTIPSMMPQTGLSAQGLSVIIGIAGYLVYGAVLGAITARLVLNAGKRRTEGIFECSTCHARFTHSQELDDHVRVAHHGVAA